MGIGIFTVGPANCTNGNELGAPFPAEIIKQKNFVGDLMLVLEIGH